MSRQNQIIRSSHKLVRKSPRTLPLTPEQLADLRRLPSHVRSLPIGSLDLESHFLVRLQNRHIGVLTVGDVVDADMRGELVLWPGVGSTVVQWLRNAVRRIASAGAPKSTHSAPV